MIRLLCVAAALLTAAARAESPAAPAAAAAVCPPRQAWRGFTADIEVSLGGVRRLGRVVVTADNRVHLEHLDDEARRWAAAALGTDPAPAKGWDTRPGPPAARVVQGRLGPYVVPVAAFAPGASARLTRHRPAAGR